MQLVEFIAEQNSLGEARLKRKSALSAIREPFKGKTVQDPKLESEIHKLILFVDDESIFRESARKVLFRKGYRVVLASNGAEGVSLFEKHLEEIKLVITDISMPVMDGLALVRALKVLNPAVCILVSSGLITDEIVEEARAAGGAGFIQKPYTAETLLKIVDKSLSR